MTLQVEIRYVNDFIIEFGQIALNMAGKVII